MTDIVSFGIPEVDKILGGGLTSGSTTYLEVDRGTQELLFIAAFLKEGFKQGNFCGVILYDFPPHTLIEKLADLGVNLREALDSGSFMIANLYSEGEYDPERRGPILTTNNLSDPNSMLRLYYDLAEAARKHVEDGTSTGIRFLIYSGSSAVANYRFEPAYKMARMARKQVSLKKVVSLVLFNPKMFDEPIVATLEDLSDAVIVLTVREINGRYQRFIRVKQSPIPDFQMNDVPYDIIEMKPVLFTANTGLAPALRNQLKFNIDGTINFMGMRLTIGEATYIPALVDYFVGILGYERFSEEVYSFFKAYGQNLFKKLMTSMDIETGREDSKRLLELFANLMSAFGFGNVKLTSFSDNLTSFRVTSSLCRESAQTGKPMNPYLAGMFAGVVEFVLSKPTKCVELKCVAKGDEYCEFACQLAT